MLVRQRQRLSSSICIRRVEDLCLLFVDWRPGLVFVTAFPDRTTFRLAVANVTWETEVWVRDAPTHLIYFDGEWFSDPYSEPLP